MDSLARYSQRTQSRKRLSSGSVLGYGARKRTEQVALESNELAIALTGGTDIRKEGFIQSKVYGYSRGWLTGWKRKYMTLENGKITFYSSKEVLSYGVEDGIPETTISLVDVRSIEYGAKGDNTFAIVLGEEKVAESFLKRTSRSLKRSFSRASINSSWSNFSDDSENSEKQYCETKMCFRIQDAAEAETWVRSILLSIRNQALFLDQAVDRLLQQNEKSELADSILRQSVDLWTLAVGPVNENTLKSKQKLAAYLQKHEDKSDEAELWIASALETQKALKKISSSGQGFSLDVEIETLKSMRRSRRITGVEKLQLEVAAFDLGYSLDEVIAYSDAQEVPGVRKWSSDISFKNL
mmetsp:Transcript_15624/g.17646  ORF Transcript_15624/g.17646 Transcript_15624/m.17646 type:complete len:354 (+) Transcript_15624:146-1207(+)